MSDVYCLQKLTTVGGPASSNTAVPQAADRFLDLQGYQDLVSWIEVKFVNVGGGAIALNIETAPIRDEFLFQAGVLVTLSPSVGTTLSKVTLALAATPLARWLRWRAVPAGPTAAWSLTFRVNVSASNPAQDPRMLATGTVYTSFAPAPAPGFSPSFSVGAARPQYTSVPAAPIRATTGVPSSTFQPRHQTIVAVMLSHGSIALEPPLTPRIASRSEQARHLATVHWLSMEISSRLLRHLRVDPTLLIHLDVAPSQTLRMIPYLTVDDRAQLACIVERGGARALVLRLEDLIRRGLPTQIPWMRDATNNPSL